MEVRRGLVLAVGSIAALVVLMVAIATREFWQLQREAYERQVLDRVKGLRIALDAEQEAAIRTLASMAEASGADSRLTPAAFRERAPRLLSHNDSWTMVAMIREDGSTAARLDRAGVPQGIDLDQGTLREVMRSADSRVSDLVALPGGNYMTFIAVPIVRAGAVRGVIYAGIAPEAWLAFLRRYPIVDDGTLTLNDRSRRIIARTLNPQNWIGKTSAPGFWDRTVGKSEGAYLAPGLEGQTFYAAFSRSVRSGWIVGTGVSKDRLEQGLRLPTFIMAVGVLCALGLSIVFAIVLGRVRAAQEEA